MRVKTNKNEIKEVNRVSITDDYRGMPMIKVDSYKIGVYGDEINEIMNQLLEKGYADLSMYDWY